MVMVTVALGLATAMSVAMLAVNASRAQVAAAAVDAATARYLAESGANIAMYYLQYPERYSGDKPDGFYPGESPIDLGKSAPGSVATIVSYDNASKVYTVGAVATVSGKASTTFSRSVDAKLQVIDASSSPIMPIVDALITNAATTIGSKTTVTGSVKSLGAVTLNGGTVTADVGSDSITVATSAILGGQSLSLVDAVVKSLPGGEILDRDALRDGMNSLTPSFAALPDLRTYKALDLLGIEVSYNATKLSSSTYGNATLGGTLLNPKGVYWIDTDLEITGNTTIDGTLILRGGRLRIRNGGNLTINPASGFPAILASSDIQMDRTANLTAGGLVYAQRVTSTAADATGKFEVTGATMLFDTTKPLPLPTEYGGTIALRFDASKANIQGIGMTRPRALSHGVRLLAWSDRPTLDDNDDDDGDDSNDK